MDALSAAATAFAVVAVAEMGDKSQLVLLAQAARHPPARVLAEAVAAFAILVALAVTVGAAAARFVPATALAIASGLLFLLFAALAWREAREPAGHDPVAGRRRGGTFLLVFASEMGDKTQVATALLAASSGQAWATGAGALAGEAAASAVAVLAGAWLGRRLPERRRARASGILFLAVGLATLGWAAWTLLAG